MKRTASAVIVLALAAALFFSVGYSQKAGVPPQTATQTALRFHAPEQKGLPPPKTDPACSSCHRNSPHAANTRARAFLNQHTGFLSCAVCHARGEAVALSRNQEGTVTTATIKGASPSPPTVSGRVHTLAGAEFVAHPGDCRSCHRRGAEYFANARFYDDYRRRLLEDLDALALMENAQ